MSKKADLDECIVAINIGKYIIDEVEQGAKEDSKKELKLKRKMWKYTGKRK